MSLDYKKLGVKCGIEIHQQLDTSKKLFCSCKSSLSDKKSYSKLKRNLRPVSGELGKVDPAVIYEYMRDRSFYYNVYENETCLVECDEEPPHAVNKEALDIVDTVCLMLKAEIPNEIHMMRKTVTDGSNTSGFQRTAVVGLNGILKTSKGDISIPVICLEEEASQIIKKKGNIVEYGLDRLGIPLIEIGTGPDIVDPQHAKEVAKKLGMILKSTQKIKRGLGTIRQDINVSIKEGNRVEIKGFQSLSKISDLVENEIQRQYNLVKIIKKLKDVSLDPKIEDITSFFKNTSNKIISKVIKNNGVVLATKLENLSGLLKTKLYKERTLGNELADYVKAYGVGGYIHTDENIDKYNISDEIKKVKKQFKPSNNDLCLLLAERKNRAQKAIDALILRIKQLKEKVPKEVRAGLPDATSSYIRPLPGSSRLYPETDVEAVYIDREKLQNLKNNLPELLDDKLKRFKAQYNLDSDLVNKLIKSKYLNLFEKLTKNHNPKIVASTLVNILPSLQRDGLDISKFREEHFREIFELIDSEKIAKEALSDIIKIWSENIDLDISEVLDKLNLSDKSENLDKFIDELISKKKDLIAKKGKRALSPLMGIVMKEYRGKVSGKKVSQLLQKMISQYS